MSKKNKIRIYCASGWFTPTTVEILDKLEKFLDKREDVELYSPRRDGVMLPPNQKHDTALREKIFNENIEHIKEADYVVANINSTDPYNDPGTMYEIGYAMANHVPVIGYAETYDNIKERFSGLLQGFYTIVRGEEELSSCLDDINVTPKKVVFVGNGDAEVDDSIVTYLMESGTNLRWVNLIHNNIYDKIDEIFQDVDYMIAVVDDRKTLSSWMIGQAYSRGIPVVTYSNYNYGINVMLLVSVLTHIRGKEELSKFLQQVKRYGLESIPKFDISQLDSM